MKLLAYSLSAFAAIAASSNIIPSVGAAQITTEELNAKIAANPAPPGYNNDGRSGAS